jgi:hypothetical protein
LEKKSFREKKKELENVVMAWVGRANAPFQCLAFNALLGPHAPSGSDSVTDFCFVLGWLPFVSCRCAE